MSNETDWDELSDEYTEHTPAIIGETIRPQRAITMDDIDDIFAGRPLADQPRRKADVLYKAYLTPTWTHRCGHRPNESTSARAL